MTPLRALVDAGHDVLLVVSQPDKRRGRGGTVTPSPVKRAAEELGLPVSQRVADVAEVGAELGVVVAFGRLIKPAVLERVPMINLHLSPLPRWRGAAPVERAILAGDTETAVCLMALDEGMDTGPVYASEKVAIGPDETAAELSARLVDRGTKMLVALLEGGPSSLPEPVRQEGTPTIAAKLDPGEMCLAWARPAQELYRVIRLGRAWTTFRGMRLRVMRARLPQDPRPVAEAGSPGTLTGTLVWAGDGHPVELLNVQPEGRQPLAADAWLRGARVGAGERLGA